MRSNTVMGQEVGEIPPDTSCLTDLWAISSQDCARAINQSAVPPSHILQTSLFNKNTSVINFEYTNEILRLS